VFNYSKLKAPFKLKNHDAIFLGYASNVRVAILYKPKTKRIVRARHFIADEFGISLEAQDQPLTPFEHCLRYYPTIETDAADVIAKRPAIEISPSDLDFITSPFDEDKCMPFEITLPPKGVEHGLIVDC
jgi:hypothetical protein